jgi:hypothetical protein
VVQDWVEHLNPPFHDPSISGARHTRTTIRQKEFHKSGNKSATPNGGVRASTDHLAGQELRTAGLGMPRVDALQTVGGA